MATAGVLLDRQMRAALIEKSVFEDFVGFGKAFLHIAKLQRHALVNVAFFAVIVNARLGSCERFFGVGDRRQDFVLDVDQVQSLERGQLFARDDGSDRISDVAHVIDAKRLLVLADRQNSVLDGHVFSGENQIHARMSRGARRVDFSDASVRMRRTQKFAVRHARQENVVGEARLTGDFRAGVDPAARDADDAQFVRRFRARGAFASFSFGMSS